MKKKNILILFGKITTTKSTITTTKKLKPERREKKANKTKSNRKNDIVSIQIVNKTKQKSMDVFQRAKLTHACVYTVVHTVYYTHMKLVTICNKNIFG